MEFKDKLKMLRKQHNLTQEKLADKLNINRTSISKYENGIQIPEVDVLKSISVLFNVSLDYLLGISDNLSAVSFKEKKDIAKDLETLKQELLHNDKLMFDGYPMEKESIQKILSALEIGMGMVREKNKAKYTSKKYKNR